MSDYIVEVEDQAPFAGCSFCPHQHCDACPEEFGWPERFLQYVGYGEREGPGYVGMLRDERGTYYYGKKGESDAKDSTPKDGTLDARQ